MKLSRKDGCWLSQGMLAGESVTLLKPRTYMNASGEAVAPVSRRERVNLGDIFAVFDDIDLPLGAMRWRAQGGDGGHRGLRSLINELESDNFPRLRVGVCPEDRPADLKEYLLSPFEPGLRGWIDRIAEAAADSLTVAVRDGVGLAANRYNGLTISPPAA
jgi:PTH1 family peptidyl-tRNA hydrolase